MNTRSFNTVIIQRAAHSVFPKAVAPETPMTLAQLVCIAVEKVEDHRLWRLTQDIAGALQPKAMLALLTYYYARQIYGSAEIQRRLFREAFQPSGDGDLPNARAIRMFRERNISALQICLAAVLLALAGQKVAAGFVTKINKTVAVAEARRRLTMAAYIDHENQVLAMAS